MEDEGIDPFYLGMLAYEGYAEIKTNPYQEKTTEYYEWREGWSYACETEGREET